MTDEPTKTNKTAEAQYELCIAKLEEKKEYIDLMMENERFKENYRRATNELNELRVEMQHQLKKMDDHIENHNKFVDATNLVHLADQKLIAELQLQLQLAQKKV
jgi:hypothetical protein